MFEHGSTTVPADFPWCGTCRYWNGKKKCRRLSLVFQQHDLYGQ